MELQLYNRKGEMVSYAFKCNYVPITAKYEIHGSRSTKYGGTILFADIIGELPNKDFIYALLKTENSDYSIGEIEIVKNTSESFSFICRRENIFESYNSLITWLKSVYGHNGELYSCFDTSSECNLYCPYCSGGYNNKKPYYYKPNYHIADHFIDKSFNDIMTGIDINKQTLRFMGGETFINFDEFKKTFDYAESKVVNKANVLMYSNFTVNIDKLILFLHNKLMMSKKIENYTFVITTDSFDYRKSLRMPTESLMRTHIDNIEMFIKSFGDNPRVKITTNIMYIDDHETEKIADFFNDRGVKYVKLGLDELNFTDEFNDKRFEIKDRCRKNIFYPREMKSFKPEHQYLLLTQFNILDLDIGRNILTQKISFDIGRNVSKMLLHENDI